jgi:alkylhydroperoxidase family enzyme
MTDIAGARRVLIDVILGAKGHAAEAGRRAAFDGAPVSAKPLLEKVMRAASKISDEDVAAAKASGLTEDEIFELVVCAAVGQASRQYEGALAALAEATETR